METRKPSAEHHRLARLSGRWVGEETIHPSATSPHGGIATGRMRGRMALGGFHLIVDYEQEREGRRTSEGHGILGWDPDAKRYTLHWFDSHGEDPDAPASGTWEGSILTLVPQRRERGLVRRVYDVDEEEVRCRLEFSEDGGEWKPILEGAYRKLP